MYTVSLFVCITFLLLNHSFFVPLTSIMDMSCIDRRSELLMLIGVSNDLRSGSLDLRGFGRLFLSYRLTIPSSGSSIMRRISAWSDESIGAMEMSRTARNLPQLLRCSFSSRKKFHTKRLQTEWWLGFGIVAIIWFRLTGRLPRAPSLTLQHRPRHISFLSAKT